MGMMLRRHVLDNTKGEVKKASPEAKVEEEKKDVVPKKTTKK